MYDKKSADRTVHQAKKHAGRGQHIMSKVRHERARNAHSFWAALRGSKPPPRRHEVVNLRVAEGVAVWPLSLCPHLVHHHAKAPHV
jgi:hypothetical protein